MNEQDDATSIPVAPAVRPITAADIESMAKVAETEAGRIEQQIAAVEKRLAAIDTNLRDDVIRERQREIRAKAADELLKAREALAVLAKKAEEQARHWTPAALRRAARFDVDPVKDATIRLATFAVLSRSSTGELMAHLQDAVDYGNLALAEAIRLEFQNRPADERDAIGLGFFRALDLVPMPAAAVSTATLQRIIGLARQADVRIGEVTSGRSDPLKRIAAARMAGGKAT
jgi:hypothetical protein